MRYLLLLPLLVLASPTPAEARGFLDWLRGDGNNNSSRRRAEQPTPTRPSNDDVAFVRSEFDWTVKNDWSPSYEKKFSEFVKAMGESGCRTLNECLTSTSGNPFYINKTPTTREFPADCADLPMALRMYFAWVEELPFDYVNEPEQANPEQEVSSDIRYTKFGNKPASRRSFTKGKTYNFLAEFTRMRDSVSTATFRMHYDFVSDFFPPSIDKVNIRPGTVVYDPSGHIGIIYKIERDGRIRMMDAHPDNSLTRITFDQKFTRSRPAHGAGFKNWRPELSTKPTTELSGFSIVQYSKKFQLGEETVTYYDYVRGQMAGGSLNFKPVEEIKTMMTELCSNVNDRVIAVDLAIKDAIQNKAHPEKLPRNIYGTDGEWEEYSSPSRDARLKVAFVEIRTEMERFIKMYREGSSRVTYEPVASKYSGNCTDKNCFLVASLMSAYEETVMSDACVFKYTKSNGAVKKLSYTNIANRLFKLSFDPYHCIELRWGASGDELSSCEDNSIKLKWYKNEQGLRNQTERTYDARMDTDVNDTISQGKEQAPDIDLWGYLGKQLP